MYNSYDNKHLWELICIYALFRFYIKFDEINKIVI